MSRLRMLFLMFASACWLSLHAGPPDSLSAGPSGVLGAAYDSYLYQARIGFKAHRFSGLILIKRLPSDGSIHTVFMSEFGLTLLDVRYRDDEFTVVSGKDFLQDPRLLKVLFNDFRLLLQDFSQVPGLDSQQWVLGEKLKFRHHGGTFVYRFQQGFEVKEAVWRRGLFPHVRMKLERNEAQQVQNIHFGHRGLPLRVEMNLVKYKGL
ncbi:hypothetical protein [Geofilum rhodophaeum]|uniref:hypothetical protein n=1 Tax=Geofilum rhodophaeum TaxID=1965019 RepID=UPI0011BAD182|nr:hypothetical protein [Geofilum rhodophaeum]